MDRLEHSHENGQMTEEEAARRLEAVTIDSEISMSVVSYASRPSTADRGFFHRILGDRRTQRSRLGTDRSDFTGDENEGEKPRCINVEPAMFLVAFVLGVMQTSASLFAYWARCVELADQFFGPQANATSVCALLTGKNYTEFNDYVERDIASTRILLQIANTLPTLIIAPVIGNWSDRSGRRRPLMFGLFGFSLYLTMQLLATCTYENISIYRWNFAAEILMGLTGGIPALFTGLLAVLTDDSRSQMRPGRSEIPIRIAIGAAMQAIGSTLGSLFVSMISVPAVDSIERHTQAYFTAAACNLGLIMATFMYVLLFLRESHRPAKELFHHQGAESVYLTDADASAESPSRIHAPSCLGSISQQASDIFQVLREHRPGHTRLCLNLSIFFFFAEFLAQDGQLLFLLLKRRPFAFSDRMFSSLATFRNICMTVGGFVGVLLLPRLRLLGKDSLLIIVGMTASAVSSAVISVSTTNEMIVAATCLTLLVGGITPAYRTFLPRMVRKEETARLFTLASLVISIAPILQSLIFNNIYDWSLSFWAGFVFLVSAALQLLIACGQLTIHCLMLPQWRLDAELQQRQEAMEKEEGEDDERQPARHGNLEGNDDEMLLMGGPADERRFGLERSHHVRAIPGSQAVPDDERSLSNTAVGSDDAEDIGGDDRAPLIV